MSGNDTSPPPSNAKPEQPKPEEKPAEKRDPWSPRFAALTRKEKELLAKDADIKTRSEKLAPLAKAQELLEKGDEVGAIQALGIEGEKFSKFMEALTHYAIKGQAIPPEVRELKARLDGIEKEKREREEADRKRATEDAERADAETKKQAKSAIASKLDEDKGEAFALIKYFGEPAVERVYDKMVEHWRDTAKWDAEGNLVKPGETMELAKAAQMVEDDLAARARSELAKLTAIAKLRPTPADPEKKQDETQPAADPFTAALAQLQAGRKADDGPKTLTNAQQGAPVRDDAETTDPEVLFQRALKLL